MILRLDFLQIDSEPVTIQNYSKVQLASTIFLPLLLHRRLVGEHILDEAPCCAS